MAAVTICSDFGAQKEIKSVTVSIFSPSICHEVKWALGSITMSKASGGDGNPVELFQIDIDDAVKSKTML